MQAECRQLLQRGSGAVQRLCSSAELIGGSCRWHLTRTGHARFADSADSVLLSTVATRPGLLLAGRLLERQVPHDQVMGELRRCVEETFADGLETVP